MSVAPSPCRSGRRSDASCSRTRASRVEQPPAVRCRGDRTAAGGARRPSRSYQRCRCGHAFGQRYAGLASSVHVGAFNLDTALGAALGGLVVKLGLGYAAVSVAGASIVWPTRLLVPWSVWPVRRAAAPACC